MSALDSQLYIVRYAPVAQMDSACDSDVSGQSSCDKAQSPANRGVERAERKNLGSVDYCLTTKFPDGREAHKFILLGTRPWRRWIARVTPTHKAAGSNPVGRTKAP